MEDYPLEYVKHNLPLILVTGLGIASSASSSSILQTRREGGTRLVFETAECQEARAKPILEQLLLYDATQQPWPAATPSESLRYRMETTGRSYILPSRKAAPLPQSPIGDPTTNKQGSNELHSPLSPLSPGSPVFPNGIMSPLWFAKHQQHVPALILAFFDFTVAGGASQDDAIKADINTVKIALGRSGFRARLAAVLVSDRSIVQSPELEERITSIRRATTLDAKTGLFLLPPMSTSADIAAFVASTLTTLQPICNEYYRELTKHARRKKARNTVPNTPTSPMHGAMQTLPPSGWNVRYEVKQGVFAEFRQETEAAERHYSQAIYDLCADDGIFQTTIGWASRWEEARLLCDTLALRVIRCLLHQSLTTAAAQSWFEYRNRMRSIVDCKGKGSHTYGWLAWESRWATIMAQLIQTANLPAFDNLNKPRQERAGAQSRFLAYAASEKASQSFERLPPSYLLHHAGYWYEIALQKSRARHVSAMAIPAEDRTPPDQSPASSVARKAESYDTYLVPEPHDEYDNAQKVGPVQNMQLVELTEYAKLEFTERDQRRVSERLTLNLARDLAEEGARDRAFETLVPLWDATIWRQELWHDLFEQLLRLLHQCAKEVRNAEIALATMWELSCATNEAQQHDLAASSLLDELDVPSKLKVALDIKNNERLSPVSATFAFDNFDAYAGEHVPCQLVLYSTASQTIKISELQLQISAQNMIVIRSQAQDCSDSDITYVKLEPEESSLIGSTNLVLASGQTHVLNLDIVFKEAGPARLERLTLIATGDRYNVVHTIDDPVLVRTNSIYHIQADELAQAELRLEDSTAVNVLPKPPKVDISVSGIKSQYLLSETPQLEIRIVNYEAETITGTLAVRALDRSNDSELPARVYTPDSESLSVTSEMSINELGPGAATDFILAIRSPIHASDCIASVVVDYKMQTDPGTSLSKTTTVTLHFVKFLDVKWSFEPLLYSERWPSYFDSTHDDSASNPSGIPHKWKAALNAHSAALAAVTIHKAHMELDRQLGDASCVIVESNVEEETIVPAGSFSRNFEITTQKHSADDRRPIPLDFICNLEWSFKGSDNIHTLTLTVPRISLPTSEPRVLCTVSDNKPEAMDAVVHYHLENLSTHFLTFALTMEPSEDFAFSGIKSRTLSLAPLSRVPIAYGILLHDRSDAPCSTASKGRWILPALQVVDSYYNKKLYVQPAGPGVKADKEGNISVWAGGSPPGASVVNA